MTNKMTGASVIRKVAERAVIFLDCKREGSGISYQLL